MMGYVFPRDPNVELPPRGRLVLIEGGVGRFDPVAERWISETGADAGRSIQWPVTWWAPLPSFRNEIP